MTKAKKSGLLWGLLAVGILGVALVLASGWRPWQAFKQTSTSQASGVIMADEITLSPSRGGRIARFEVNEGDAVRTGQELVMLDTTLLDAQIAVAEAQLAVAQASLQQIASGARPGALTTAQAQWQQAQVAHLAATQALSDALVLRDHPQQLDMQIAVAEAQVTAAEYRLGSALALKDAAETAKNLLQYSEDQIKGWKYPVPSPSLPSELLSAPYDWWRGWSGVNAAQASLETAKAQLAHWRAVRAYPQQLNAQVEAARATQAQATAALDAAQAQLDGLRAGASAEQLAAARAREVQAQAALDALRAQRADLRVLAPTDGTVLAQLAHAGEVTMPGGALLSLASLDRVHITVYVAENQLGQVSVNQTVMVQVDAFPGRLFEGEIEHIADQAQYTPRSVATKEERVNTVYAVEIGLPNAEGLLKPGMPADVTWTK